MNKMLLSVVCYDNENEIINFGKIVSRQSLSKNITLIITCNKSSKIDFLINEFKKIKLESHIYNPSKNLGYLPGVIYGIEEYTKENGDNYEWIFICNTDISFESNHFFESFFDLNKNDKIWCVGPNILLAYNQKPQNPFLIERPSNFKIKFWKFIYSNYYLYSFYVFLSKIKGQMKHKSAYGEETKYVYSVHGSAFFIKKDCYHQLQSLKEKTFMYGEELLISEIIYKNNKNVLFYSDIVIFHNENQTTSKIAVKQKQIWFKQSINMIYSNYFKNRSTKNEKRNRSGNCNI